MTLPDLPSRFYRYRSVAGDHLERVRKMVAEGEHFFSSPSAFNDPFDCQPVYRFASDTSTVRSYLERLFAKFEPNLSQAELGQRVDEVLADPSRDPRLPDNAQLISGLVTSFGTNRTGVICLCESGSVPLMWSHYSDSHRGVCLGYDSSEHPFTQALPVQYSKLRPFVDPTVHTRIEMLDRSLYTKSSDWAYEKEWRLVLPEGEGVRRIPRTALKEIIIGAAADRDLLQTVIDWTLGLDHDVAIYKASPSITTFEVDLQRYR